MDSTAHTPSMTHAHMRKYNTALLPFFTSGPILLEGFYTKEATTEQETYI